jgi:predicted heme/steroid binding protein
MNKKKSENFQKGEAHGNEAQLQIDCSSSRTKRDGGHLDGHAGNNLSRDHGSGG